MPLLDQTQAFGARLKQAWGRLSQKQKWVLAATCSVVFAMVFTLIWLGAGDAGMVPVSSPVRDLPAAKAELARYGIDSEVSTAKSDLLVPRDKKDRAMLILNAARLLPDGLGHYAFLGETDFTSTEPQRYERIRVEIEDLLRQTIRAMDGVRQASVRITPAGREVLFKPESGRNKASVTVELSGRRELSPEQVLSIANLVSASYPNLRSEDVFIHDTAGKPYVLRGDAQLTADKLKLRQGIEHGFEDKVVRALTGLDPVVAATVEMRLIDETTTSTKDYQPRGDEPLVEYIETSKDKRIVKDESGTAGIRAEAQNSNRTDAGRRTGGNTEESSQLLEKRVLDEETRSELERMKLVIDYDRSSLAVSLAQSLAEDESSQAALRTRAQNLVSKATGLDPSRIAIEFTPRVLPESDPGMVNSLIGDGWFEDTGRIVIYGLLLLLVLGTFWVLRGVAKRPSGKSLEEDSPPDMPEDELFKLPNLPKPGQANLESNLIFEQVSKLVDENPQAAANLLKRWMIFNE